VMRESCDEVLEVLGLENDPLFRLAKKLEKIALEDEYFVSKKTLPKCRFLLWHYSQSAGNSRRNVHSNLRHRPHRWLDFSLE